jgi:glucokinase
MRPMKTAQDSRIVMTLDAGGTNFIFSAIQGNHEMVPPLRKPSYSDDLQRCLETVVEGFREIRQQLPGEASAISFAFPGPADYPLGIIGDLPNFKAFSGGVPLGPMLEDQFGIPVYINNDGNLFAYGEAAAGFLPSLNRRLKEAGSLKTYTSLVGFTLGTGFGAGIVMDNQMLVGNSSCGAEIHNTLNALNPSWNAEESVSTRAIQRVYTREAGSPAMTVLMPSEIADIARGDREGDREAARKAFGEFGLALGYSVANTLALVDGIAVLGGGITAAWDLFAPSMFKAINGSFQDPGGNPLPRLSYRVYDLEDDALFGEFARGRIREVVVPSSGRKVVYDDLPRTGVGRSSLGASRSIALGAYLFALRKLDEKQM